MKELKQEQALLEQQLQAKHDRLTQERERLRKVMEQLDHQLTRACTRHLYESILTENPRKISSALHHATTPHPRPSHVGRKSNSEQGGVEDECELPVGMCDKRKNFF
ncbi:MAG: hypothetical protein GY821_02835 [Gammaproteobacteria bacterium]|nr:hypothetical protein [Gammaproteobacteria bacterium]